MTTKEIPTISLENRKSSKDFSRAYLTKDFSLYSNTAQFLFELLYSKMDRALYVLTVVCFERKSLEDTQAMEGKINAAFDEIEDELRITIKEMVESLKEKGVSTNEQVASFDHKRQYKTPVRTPQAIRYLSLFEKLDQLNAINEALRINNIVSLLESKQTEKKWDSYLRDFSRKINQLELEIFPIDKPESKKGSLNK